MLYISTGYVSSLGLSVSMKSAATMRITKLNRQAIV